MQKYGIAFICEGQSGKPPVFNIHNAHKLFYKNLDARVELNAFLVGVMFHD